MTLRQKTLWVMGSALIVLLLLLLSISSTIFLKGFYELENQAIKKNVNRLINVLADEINNLSIEAAD